jgi:hypothetical protein
MGTFSDKARNKKIVPNRKQSGIPLRVTEESEIV